MAIDPTPSDSLSEDPQVTALHRRVADAERELAERAAAANSAIAAAQDRSYWLDRWQLDLNGMMTTPAGRSFRAGVRVVRAFYRVLYRLHHRLRQRLRGA